MPDDYFQNFGIYIFPDLKKYQFFSPVNVMPSSK
jgi:hypothetical protein